jgi:acyl carrier protein
MEWGELMAEVAPFTEVAPERISRDSMLIEDLGLDSLALTELLITLIEEHGAEPLTEELFSRSWERVTLGELFSVYCAGGGAAEPAPQPSIQS